MIILLKACLYSLKTFSNKRITCLEQIKKIIGFITQNKEIPYDDTIKKILKYGTQTIYLAVRTF